jgi:hypothetical protein
MSHILVFLAEFNLKVLHITGSQQDGIASGA